MRKVRASLLPFFFPALEASRQRLGKVLRRINVKLILRSYVIRLSSAFRCDLGRALVRALGRTGRAETLRYRQQDGSDGCCCRKSGHFRLGLHEWCNVCVAVWCVDLTSSI